MKDLLITTLMVIGLGAVAVLGFTTLGFVGLSIYHWSHGLTLAAALWEAFSTSAIVAVVALLTAITSVLSVKALER